MKRAEHDPSKGSNEDPKEIILDNDTLADVQRGYHKRPEFYGNASQTNSFKSFTSGVSTAFNFAGHAVNAVSNLLEKRGDNDAWQLTKAEYAEIEKKAVSISAYGNTPLQTVIDFLVILCSIDNLQDMEKIALGIEVYDLIDIDILRQPYLILQTPKLEKIAYMASALDALVKLFSRFLEAANISDNKPEDISNIMSSLGNILGGLSGGASARMENSSASDALGHFMSELLEGKRIPMTIIAKNPMKQSPSFVGQALFGEAPTSLSLMDIKELFPKKIGVFPMPSNGAGTSAFGMQNFKSLQGPQTLTSMINKLSFGGSDITPGSFKETAINLVKDQVKTLTGAREDETFSLNHADTAIPVMIAMSAVNSGLEKSPFSSETFKNAWVLANGVSNMMQSNSPNFLNIIRNTT